MANLRNKKHCPICKHEFLPSDLFRVYDSENCKRISKNKRSSKYRLLNLTRLRQCAKIYNANNKSKIAERKSEWRIKRRIKVLKHYGDLKCSCCGEDEILFLALDHVDGGGSIQRRSIKRAGDSFYRWIIFNNFPEGFRVLCHNCNWGVHVNHGICPHKDQLASLNRKKDN